jgi:hypothetical protein
LGKIINFLNLKKGSDQGSDLKKENGQLVKNLPELQIDQNQLNQLIIGIKMTLQMEIPTMTNQRRGSSKVTPQLRLSQDQGIL